MTPDVVTEGMAPRSVGLPLARAHGAFNVAFGVWPLLHMRSFEAVLGPKVDGWLVRTVGGLMVGNGLAQLSAREPAEVAVARRVGIGTAVTLGAIDLRYGATGRISRVYLVDSVAQVGWVLAWMWLQRRD